MTKICDLLGLRERKFKRDGSRWQELMGIELELENVTNQIELPYWEVKADNSLRNGVEYILDQPYAGESLEYALDEFFDAKLKCTNSSRTSTHVHLNMTDSTLATVRSMVMIMYAIEDALYNIVGEGRKWAGYSMALSEMDPIRMRQALSSADDRVGVSNMAPARNQERYYGFNTASLRKHGTVEFRYFPGGPTRIELEDWLDLIVAVKAAAVDNSPEQLIERIYNPDGMYAFLERYLPMKWVNKLLREVSPAYMYDKFNQVAALATDPEVIESKDNIVFMTPSFTRLVKSKMLSDASRKFIDEVAKSSKAMTPGDWYHYLETARAKDNLPPVKAKPKAGMKLKEIYAGGDFDVAPVARINPFGDYNDYLQAAAIPPAPQRAHRVRAEPDDNF